MKKAASVPGQVQSTPAGWARTAALVAATIGPLIAGACWHFLDHDPPAALWIPVGFLVLSGLLVHHRSPGSQILARGVWWANFLLGCLLSFVGNGREQTLGAVLVLATGIPLLAVSKIGLGENQRSHFQPVAFRTTLTLAMTMAVADAQAFLFWGVLGLTDGLHGDATILSRSAQSWTMIGIAVALTTAIVGLYRLRAWGLLLAASLGVATIGLFLSHVLDLRSPLPEIFIATAAIQLLLPLPVFAAIFGKKPVSEKQPSPVWRALPSIVITAMLASSLYVALHRLF